jgi:hypothetical protein
VTVTLQAGLPLGNGGDQITLRGPVDQTPTVFDYNWAAYGRFVYGGIGTPTTLSSSATGT